MAFAVRPSISGVMLITEFIGEGEQSDEPNLICVK